VGGAAIRRKEARRAPTAYHHEVHNPIVFAVPVFLVAIAAEVLWAQRTRRAVIRFDDALADLACGVTSQGIGVFLKLLTLPLYAFFFTHGALFQLEATQPLAWVVGIVGYDFFYYWWHRKSHEWNALWAIHVVHHQSDDFNLAVALRQDWLGPLTSSVFGLPLAFLGVPPLVYLTSVSVSLLYQFWIHTELIGKLGRFEQVFNTPSHHRVHHGTNPQYLDKNYGGILIVWDRLFGTFEIEDEAPAYGVTTLFQSFDAIHANLSTWGELARLSRKRHGIVEKIGVLFEPPGYDPVLGRVVPPAFDRARPKFRSSGLSFVSSVFLVTSFLGAVGLLLWMLWNETTLPLSHLALGTCALLALSVSWSSLLEGRARGRLVGALTTAASCGGILLFWHMK
jgi:alkylglycerol monooxygenase